MLLPHKRRLPCIQSPRWVLAFQSYFLYAGCLAFKIPQGTSFTYAASRTPKYGIYYNDAVRCCQFISLTTPNAQVLFKVFLFFPVLPIFYRFLQVTGAYSIFPRSHAPFRLYFLCFFKSKGHMRFYFMSVLRKMAKSRA